MKSIKTFKKMSNIQSILSNFDFDRDKYISKEWQKFGYDLASFLGDLKNKSLYMKLAKTNPRLLLLDALAFVKGASNVKSKPRLFMWKLKELKLSKATESKKENAAE
ncbi:hypothetical protein HY345_03075 [Candidatus Microgenomates bacterium]|nr:hypothetical protein [Candidatus Microgenomates bacterium]